MLGCLVLGISVSVRLEVLVLVLLRILLLFEVVCISLILWCVSSLFFICWVSLFVMVSGVFIGRVRLMVVMLLLFVGMKVKFSLCRVSGVLSRKRFVISIIMLGCCRVFVSEWV